MWWFRRISFGGQKKKSEKMKFSTAREGIYTYCFILASIMWLVHIHVL